MAQQPSSIDFSRGRPWLLLHGHGCWPRPACPGMQVSQPQFWPVLPSQQHAIHMPHALAASLALAHQPSTTNISRGGARPCPPLRGHGSRPLPASPGQPGQPSLVWDGPAQPSACHMFISCLLLVVLYFPLSRRVVSWFFFYCLARVQLDTGNYCSHLALHGFLFLLLCLSWGMPLVGCIFA
jgi:hypothetical protein